MKTLDKHASFAAEGICNLFATAYMDVHNNAGPWGIKHLEDLELIIQTAINAATFEKDKRIAAISALLDKTFHDTPTRRIRHEDFRLTDECWPDCVRCAWERMKKETQ